MKLVVVSHDKNLKVISKELQKDCFEVQEMNDQYHYLIVDVLGYQYQLALHTIKKYDEYCVDDLEDLDCFEYPEKKILKHTIVYIIND